MNVMILNLARSTSQKALTELFSQYGTVESCDIVMDKHSGESKGFGFIKMSSDEEANAAIISLHARKFDGNKLRVKLSTKAE